MINLPINIDYKDKVVVVTGAGGLICGAMARAFAQSGAKVAALDLNEEAAQKVADGINAKGGTAKAYKCNCLDKADIESVHQKVLADFGKTIIICVVLIWYSTKLCQYKGISVMFLWVIAVCLIYHFITSKTAFGRYFYAVGGNEKATKLSGINTNKVYFIAYVNMGFLAGLCGLLCLARVGSVSGATGQSFEMDAIGSCFIGGASAYGGSGTIPGVIIGALLLGVINMGMSIKGIGDSWQYIVKGAVLLIAVIFDVVSSRKSGAA